MPGAGDLRSAQYPGAIVRRPGTVRALDAIVKDGRQPIMAFWHGRILPATYYFRTVPRFETAHPKYAFLNRLLAVSSGDRRAEGPIYTIAEIL